MAKKTKVTRGSVFSAKNFHFECCGKPPGLKAGKGLQTSYFENDLGEQMVYVFDTKLKKAVVYHGDTGWSPAHRVDLKTSSCSVVMDEDERAWLKACVIVSNHFLKMKELYGGKEESK